MRVLVACERSGVVRDAFAARGHDAWSCDLEATRAPGPHIEGDVRDVLHDGWELMIAHPPCQYLAASGLHWNKRVEGRHEKTESALAFVRVLMDAPIPRICIENPVGCISTRIRRADQRIQPFMFGDDASKATHLWLKGLLPLQRTKFVVGRESAASRKLRFSNQTDSGQNRLGPSPERAEVRARTYPGIARAMAEQWGTP